ncbi:hypothetical protein DQE15_24380, partial [Salmonella enterica subsp. enterica serovar Stanley]|nr:hypothetical protein [Salmonella enterica subsp. enterica serovar Stanley]
MRHSIVISGEDGDAGMDPQGSHPEAPPSIFLDPWLIPIGEPLLAITDNLMAVTTPDGGPRKRSPRVDALERRRFLIGNLVANLASLTLSPFHEPGTTLAVATAKTKHNSYDRQGYPKRLIAGTLEAMEKAGIIRRTPYVFKMQTTLVEPAAALLDLMSRHGVKLSDIGQDAGAETIWLRARDIEVSAYGWRRGSESKHFVEYQETEETLRLRAEMETINAVLNRAGIAYDGLPVGPIALRRVFLLRSPKEPQHFTLNGRLWGGFWQNLKSNRRHLITIGGEDIVDLDYTAMFGALAYLMKTGKLPELDPYAVPGLEDHRDGAKLGLLSLLSRTGPMRSLAPHLKALLPPGWTAWMLEGEMSHHNLPIS